MSGLAGALKAEAHRLGFDLCRIVPAGEAPHADFFDAWVEGGRAAAMEYLARNRDKRRFPARLAEPPSAPFRSIIVLAVDYHRFDLSPDILNNPGRGILARYAWGDDYHEIIRPLLHTLDGFLRAQTGRTTLGKALVDSGPVLERDWAQRASVGFFGKNTCLIRPGRGSWMLLATLHVPEVLEYDAPPVSLAEPPPAEVLRGLEPSGDYGAWSIPLEGGGAATGTCGRCTRCLAACPTNAFDGPYHLDARRCISYWTIETHDPIPRILRRGFGNRIFGCDICQEVCPWNRRLAERTPLLEGLQTRQGRFAPLLLEGFAPESPYWVNDNAFADHFRRSPIKRAKRAGMLRNVCVALGNWGAAEALPALKAALWDREEAGRGHAAWALGQLLRRRDARANDLLRARQEIEGSDWVREEIALALAG
jgi:epoxyqueuosine reductase